MKIQELARLMGTSVSDAREAVRGLQQKGLLKAPAKNREAGLELTDKGRVLGRTLGFNL
jgi:Mn-dependent DtxR family transcriptional regulator